MINETKENKKISGFIYKKKNKNDEHYLTLCNQAGFRRNMLYEV